ncbi:MAG: hypothetical protein IPI71_06200 [Methanolinea sp.]|nr:MAG: hypothetical protein IPI71_06200 [Methanolinea sp.]
MPPKKRVARGARTSHAAVVARQMERICVGVLRKNPEIDCFPEIVQPERQNIWERRSDRPD